MPPLAVRAAMPREGRRHGRLAKSQRRHGRRTPEQKGRLLRGGP